MRPDTVDHTVNNSCILVLLLLSLSIASSCVCVHAENEAHPPLRRIGKSLPAMSEGLDQGKDKAKIDVQSLSAKAVIGRDIDFDLFLSPKIAPSMKMKALHVRIRNRSDEPLIFDGDRSSINDSQSDRVLARAITQKELDAVDRPPTTFTGKLSSDLKATVTAAASVGVVQTVDTLKREYGPIEKRYEYDQERRTNEESRFGERLLYPGDSTDGEIYLSPSASLEGHMLKIPVRSFYDKAELGSLSKIIQINSSLPSRE